MFSIILSSRGSINYIPGICIGKGGIIGAVYFHGGVGKGTDSSVAIRTDRSWARTFVDLFLYWASGDLIVSLNLLCRKGCEDH